MIDKDKIFTAERPYPLPPPPQQPPPGVFPAHPHVRIHQVTGQPPPLPTKAIVSEVETPYGRFRYFDNDLIGQAISGRRSQRERFWDAHFKPWMDALKPGSLMVDVGANIGFFSVYLALRGVRVEAFEPCPEVFALLSQNVLLNGVSDKVRAHQTALYDRRTRMTVSRAWTPPTLGDGLTDYGKCDNAGGFSLVPGEGRTPYEVEAHAFDEFELPDVALIKVDAQGCDLRIIVGAERTIRRCRPVLCYEVEELLLCDHGDTVARGTGFVESLGYRTKAVGGIPAVGYTDFVAEPMDPGEEIDDLWRRLYPDW